LTLRIE